MENNIDDIFKEAIEPLATQPSEEFWRKAAEDVIARGNKAAETKVARWKAAAFVLGAGLVLLGYFTYRIQNGLDNVDKKIETAKNMQSQNIDKSNAGAAAIQNDNNVIANTIGKKPVAVKPYTNHSILADIATTGAKITASTVNNRISYKRTVNTSKTVASANRVNNRSIHHKPVELSGNKTNGSVAYNNPNANVPVIVHANNITNNTAEDNVGSISTYSLATHAVLKNDSANNQVSDDDTASDIAGQTTAASISDTVKIMLPKTFASGDSISRLSVSVIFAPDYLVNYKFKATDAWGNQSENIIKNGEKQTFSYSTGAIAEYKLSPKVSISAGIVYQLFSFTTQPGTIYDKKQSDGDVGYYMATSSGIINCSYAGYSKVGDSLRVNTSSTRKYIDIPLQAKYFFMTATKFRVYATVGVEVNFSVGENMVMNWQNYSTASGTEDIANAEGSRNMYFSYYAGIGFSYKVANSLSFFVEPGFHEAVTPIDDNIDIITYPRLFSVEGGITYTVK